MDDEYQWQKDMGARDDELAHLRAENERLSAKHQSLREDYNMLSAENERLRDALIRLRDNGWIDHVTSSIVQEVNFALQERNDE